jgi:hypothetical protein
MPPVWGFVRGGIALLIVCVPIPAQESYSPRAKEAFATHVYWGDTHLHTRMSFDAYISRGNRLGPDEAYRFAKGQAVTASNGMIVRLGRPLDFLVVADHAENLGVAIGLVKKDTQLLNSKAAREMWQRLREIEEAKNSNPERAAALATELHRVGFRQGAVGNREFTRSIWQQVIATADRHNDPERFTAFIGYEWTALGPGGGNVWWHRNVIFKDGADKAGQVVPFSRYDSDDPAALWAYMAQYEQKTGGEVLAIAHNANFSGGAMFALREHGGQPLSKRYAQARSRWEPLYEVTQIKGTSETHPLLSPTDEFANYEIWDMWSEPGNLAFEYARSALKLGLGQHAALGVNPFKFGLIGSTDSHTSISSADDNNFWGSEPSAQRISVQHKNNAGEVILHGWQLAASGYAGVWATQNTREALFGAMKRKETYATTGPRMTVRFFGGWDYSAEDAFKPDLASLGYRKGVPMGGDLTKAPAGKAPAFLIRAVKDPDGANLDRVQVIKGWIDAQGGAREKVHDIVLSDGRKPNKEGKAPPVGSTVDVKNASYTNMIGDPELAVVWTDPDFDERELAFYYVRVLEIPTPRWTAYDATFFASKQISPDVPMVTQERAYTSPIWYSP